MTKEQPIAAFIGFAGDLAESFSLNRSLGMIYGLLYLREGMTSLEEIASVCGMSKGNASLQIRVLESWGAVRRRSLSGSRKDHYEANRDVRGLAVRRLKEGLTRRLDTAEERMGELKSGGLADATALKRLDEVQSMMRKARKGLTLLEKALSFL